MMRQLAIIHAFLISKYANTKENPANTKENPANTKENPEAELLLLEYYYLHSSSMLSS